MHNCRKCGDELVVGENWYAAYKKRMDYICIKCQLAYSRQYQANHREEKNERSRQRYADHREEERERGRQRYAKAKVTEVPQGVVCRKCNAKLVVGKNWYPSTARKGDNICIECGKDYRRKHYIEHQEEVKERASQYYADHREECNKRSRQYYNEHREEAAVYAARWRKENPGKKREIEQCRRARLAGVTTEFVDNQVVFERYNCTCIYCGSKKNLTIDHIVAINAGGPHCEDNLVAACRSCNSSKRDSPLAEWLQTQPKAQAWVV